MQARWNCINKLNILNLHCQPATAIILSLSNTCFFPGIHIYIIMKINNLLKNCIFTRIYFNKKEQKIKMRTIIKIWTLTLLLMSIISCKKDNPIIPNCGQEFYYYQDQKIYLYITKQKITIGFIDTLTFQEMKNTLDNYIFIKPLEEGQAIENKKLALPNLKDNLTCDQIDQGIKELTDNSNISYANSFLLPKNNNTLMGITGEFIVNIKDTSQITELQSLAIQTNTTIIKQNEFIPEVYILNADKNSSGNALKMANYFYETGKFEYAEPNFLRIMKKIKNEI